LSSATFAASSPFTVSGAPALEIEDPESPFGFAARVDLFSAFASRKDLTFF